MVQILCIIGLVLILASLLGYAIDHERRLKNLEKDFDALFIQSLPSMAHNIKARVVGEYPSPIKVYYEKDGKVATTELASPPDEGE